MLCSAIAYWILTKTLIARHGKNSTLATTLGRGLKEKISMVIYTMAIPLGFFKSWIACLLYILAAFMWLIPDRRIEKALNS